MDGRIQRRVAWALAVASLAAILAAAALTVINYPVGSNQFVIGDLTPVLVGLIYPAVGALVVSRQPRNAVGWLLCALGLTVALTAVAGGYAIRGLVSAPGSLAGAAVVAWFQAWSLGWWFALGVPLLFLIFPDGRLPSQRWRPILPLLGLLLLIQEAILLFTQRQLAATTQGTGLRINNPTGFIVESFWSRPGGRILTAAIDLLFALVIGACGAAMLLRLRRSQGVERQQIKWLAYAATLLVAQLAVYFGLQAAGITAAMHEGQGTLSDIATDLYEQPAAYRESTRLPRYLAGVYHDGAQTVVGLNRTRLEGYTSAQIWAGQSGADAIPATHDLPTPLPGFQGEVG